MRKIKLYISLLLTAAVLICGAILPQWVASLQDTRALGSAGQRQMRSVSLDIQEQIPMMGKLALLRHHDSAIRISPYDASMTEEEAKDAFDAALLTYIQAGLIPSFPREEYVCIPYLFQDPESLEHYAIFWYCYHESKLPASDYIHLYLDDETGCVMNIEYYNAEHKAYTGDEIDTRLDTLCRIYFESLAIEDYAGRQTDLLSRPYKDYEGFDGSTQIRAYVFDDGDFGPTRVEFVLFSGGFYTMFPDS